MEKYEKIIGLKSIWLTIVRRFVVAIIVFAPIALATIVYTQFFITKTYISSGTFSTSSDINTQAYASLFPPLIKSEETAKEAERELAKLDEEGNQVFDENNQPLKATTHTDGSKITWREIQNGIYIASSVSATTRLISFSFQSTDSKICQPTVQAVLDVLNGKEIMNGSTKVTLSISKMASSVSKNSSENKYLLIGLAAALVLGLGFAFIDEIVSDEVYDKKDIELLGCDGFEITVNK